MTSAGNTFSDFPETVPTREITTKREKTFLAFSSVVVRRFLEWAASVAPPPSSGAAHEHDR